MLSWFTLPRIPEPEVMDDSAEVEAYASAATQAYLDKIDDTFVEHAVRLVRGRSTGRALDIGTGPGQIVLKLARRPTLRDWHFIGVDHSANMIAQARKAALDAGLTGSSHRDPVELEGRGGACPEDERGNPAKRETPKSTAELVPSPPRRVEGAPEARLLGGPGLSPDMMASQEMLASAAEVPDLPQENLARVQFFIADGNRLPFPDASFDLVMSNSVLHHLVEPQRMLAEIARLAKPGAAILIRDLRRPSRLAYPLHVRWYGRHYSDLMYQLYSASVRSSYTVAELEGLLRRSRLQGARPFTHHRTHLGIERALGASS